MPYLLYIDTSGKVATVALSSGHTAPVVRTHHNANEQAAVLNAMINEVLIAAGIQLKDIDAFCVCAGPGSYTGLRVGLSTAKGMAYALDKPLMLFNSLDLAALEYKGAKPFALAWKAREGEYFFAQYDDNARQKMAPGHIFKAELEEITGTEKLLIITDDEHLDAKDVKRIAGPGAVNINLWIPVAEERFAAKQFDDLAYSEPFYLKAAYTTVSKK